MTNQDVTVIPVWGWGVLAAVLFAQGVWVFRDAQKRGENKWLWGFFALLNVPSSLIIYLIVTRKILRPKKCSTCGCRTSSRARYCPACGHKF